ncbi:unnamed protein product [Lota lota]
MKDPCEQKTLHRYESALSPPSVALIGHPQCRLRGCGFSRYQSASRDGLVGGAREPVVPASPPTNCPSGAERKRVWKHRAAARGGPGEGEGILLRVKLVSDGEGNRKQLEN